MYEISSIAALREGIGYLLGNRENEEERTFDVSFDVRGPLGIKLTLRRSEGVPGSRGVVVATSFPRDLATGAPGKVEESGVVQLGDELIAVNGQEVAPGDFASAASLLASPTWPLTLRFKRSPSGSSRSRSSSGPPKLDAAGHLGGSAESSSQEADGCGGDSPLPSWEHTALTEAEVEAALVNDDSVEGDQRRAEAIRTLARVVGGDLILASVRARSSIATGNRMIIAAASNGGVVPVSPHTREAPATSSGGGTTTATTSTTASVVSGAPTSTTSGDTPAPVSTSTSSTSTSSSAAAVGPAPTCGSPQKSVGWGSGGDEGLDGAIDSAAAAVRARADGAEVLALGLSKLPDLRRRIDDATRKALEVGESVHRVELLLEAREQRRKLANPFFVVQAKAEAAEAVVAEEAMLTSAGTAEPHHLAEAPTAAPTPSASDEAAGDGGSGGGAVDENAHDAVAAVVDTVAKIDALLLNSSLRRLRRSQEQEEEEEGGGGEEESQGEPQGENASGVRGGGSGSSVVSPSSEGAL